MAIGLVVGLSIDGADPAADHHGVPDFQAEPVRYLRLGLLDRDGDVLVAVPALVGHVGVPCVHASGFPFVEPLRGLREHAVKDDRPVFADLPPRRPRPGPRSPSWVS